LDRKMPLLLTSGFAAVEVDRDDNGNGPRLRIRDLRSGKSVCLDPLELAALVWVRHDDLLPFLDPSRLDPNARRRP
jgi:hypothetical protein